MLNIAFTHLYYTEEWYLSCYNTTYEFNLFVRTKLQTDENVLSIQDFVIHIIVWQVKKYKKVLGNFNNESFTRNDKFCSQQEAIINTFKKRYVKRKAKNDNDVFVPNKVQKQEEMIKPPTKF